MRDPGLILRHLGAVLAVHVRVLNDQLAAADRFFADQRPLGSSGAQAFTTLACCEGHVLALEAEVAELFAELDTLRKKTHD